MCGFIFSYTVHVLGKKRASKMKEINLNFTPFVFLVTVKVYCVRTDRYNVRKTVAYFR